MAERVDNRHKQLLLARRAGFGLVAALSGALMLASPGTAAPAAAAEPALESTDAARPEPVQVIKPEVRSRQVTVARIDDESFEIGVYAGILNIDNFGSEPVYGIKASYFTTEDLFLQLNYGRSRAGLSTFESVSGFPMLTDDERDYSYYNVLVGYNIFPGEVFMTSKLAFNSSIYLVGGVGNTEFAGENNFTTILGTGYRIVLRDWLTWHVDFRDHIFKTDLFNQGEITHNMEMTTGVTAYF